MRTKRSVAEAEQPGDEGSHWVERNQLNICWKLMEILHNYRWRLAERRQDPLRVPPERQT